jgi:hypothetical protein
LLPLTRADEVENVVPDEDLVIDPLRALEQERDVVHVVLRDEGADERGVIDLAFHSMQGRDLLGDGRVGLTLPRTTLRAVAHAVQAVETADRDGRRAGRGELRSKEMISPIIISASAGASA